MHFIAMMAVQFPVLINYNIVETVPPIGIAVCATATGLYVVSTRRLGYFSIPGAGVLRGSELGACTILAWARSVVAAWITT
jgi:NO-binding membrane sensor protein with MHYT domain